MSTPAQRINAAFTAGLVPVPGGDAVEWIRANLETGFTLTQHQMALLGAAMETGMRGLRGMAAAMSTAMSTARRTGSSPLHALHAQLALRNDLEDDVAGPTHDPDHEDEDDEFDDEEDGDDEDGGDLLARIDELTGNMCVCGCRRRIKPGGASPDFAKPSCQRTWHRQYATDPQDVYQRRDAARPYASNDTLPVPLQEANGTFTEDGTGMRSAAAGPDRQEERPAWRGQRLPACPDPRGAAYRRHCPRCATDVIPDVYTSDDIPVHLCPGCRELLPGPAYIPDVINDATRLTLQLRDDNSRAHQVITIARLDNSPDPQALIRDTWAHLEVQLGQFRRAWRGTNNR